MKAVKNVFTNLFFKVFITTLLLVAVILLMGCKPRMIKAEPIASNCADMCYTSCLDDKGGTGVYWAASPEDAAAWDSLFSEVITPLVVKLKTCELHRKACEQCLMNLKTEKVIQ